MQKTLNSRNNGLFNPQIGPSSGATILGLGEPGSDSNEVYSAFSKAPALREPHPQIALGGS